MRLGLMETAAPLHWILFLLPISPATNVFSPSLLQTLYCAAWSPNAQGKDSPCTWLAFGGQAGLVRCMRLSVNAGYM